MEATTGTSTTAATSSTAPSAIQTGRSLQQRSPRSLRKKTTEAKRSNQKPSCSACSSRWAFCSIASSSVRPPLESPHKLTPHALYRHGPQCLPRASFYRPLHRDRFPPCVLPFASVSSWHSLVGVTFPEAIIQSPSFLVFGQRGDLGGGSRHCRNQTPAIYLIWGLQARFARPCISSFTLPAPADTSHYRNVRRLGAWHTHCTTQVFRRNGRLWGTDPTHGEARNHGVRVRAHHTDWSSYWPCAAVLPRDHVRPCFKVCTHSRGNNERPLSGPAAVGESRRAPCCWYAIPSRACFD